MFHVKHIAVSLLLSVSCLVIFLYFRVGYVFVQAKHSRDKEFGFGLQIISNYFNVLYIEAIVILSSCHAPQKEVFPRSKQSPINRSTS